MEIVSGRSHKKTLRAFRRVVQLRSCESAAGLFDRLLCKLATPLSWACAPPQWNNDFSFIILEKRNNIRQGGQDVHVGSLGKFSWCRPPILPDRVLSSEVFCSRACEITTGNDLFETSVVTYNRKMDHFLNEEDRHGCRI